MPICLETKRKEAFIALEETKREREVCEDRRAGLGGGGESPQAWHAETKRGSRKKHPLRGNPRPSTRARLLWSSETETEQVETDVTVLLRHWLSLM